MRLRKVTAQLSAAPSCPAPARWPLRAVAVALAMCATMTGLTLSAAPSEAGVDSSMCRSDTARLSAAKFALPVCFDGQTLIVRNDSDFPVHIFGNGSAGEPYQQPYAGVPEASSLALTYIRPGDNALLMPGYQLLIPIGSGAASVQLAGTDLATTYAVLKAISSVLPTQAITPIVDSISQLTTELVDVWSQYQACMARNGWLGQLGCEALYDRNVGFAIGRAVAHGAVGAVAAAILNLFDTALWAASATNADSAELLHQVRGGTDGTIRLTQAAGAPVPSNPDSPGSGPTLGAPATPPSGPLHFAVTGSCTSDGGTLSSTSSGFTPGGAVRIHAWYPNGSAYTDLVSTGRVRGDGSATWTWPCKGDPGGTYSTEVVDTLTGRRTGRVDFTIGAGQPTPTPTTPTTPTPTPTTPTPTPTPTPTTMEQAGSHGSPAFQNPSNASGQGPTVPAMANVEVSCKVHPASTIGSANPDGYWYRISSSPWNNNYYVVANTFWNGDVPGQTPYTHNTDWNVPDC